MSSSSRRRRRRRLYPALAAFLILPLAAIAMAVARSPAPPPAAADAGAAPREPAGPAAARPSRAAEVGTEGVSGRERAGGKGATARAAPEPRLGARRRPIRWRRSVAVGTHSAGQLGRGVLLPSEGRAWVSWDPILKRRPGRQWRRWGTDAMLRATLRVLRELRAEHPRAPRIVIGDLSRPRGGDFGPQYGFIGHASHQNGLDIDIYYPRTDRRLRPPKRPSQVDTRLAQELVDRLVAAGTEKIFVGPSLPLSGPPAIVQSLVHHDNHLHARFPLAWAR